MKILDYDREKQTISLIYIFVCILTLLGIYTIDFVHHQLEIYTGIDLYNDGVPYEYHIRYGTYPFIYYHLKFIRFLIYILWLFSIILIFNKIKIKILKINIVYPILFTLSALIFTMMTMTSLIG